MKRLSVILLALLLLAGLAGCAKEEEGSSDTRQLIEVPEELQGSYHEEIAGRGMLELGADHISIDWNTSAFERNHIDFPAGYDAESGNIVYENAVMSRYTYTSETEFTSSEIYNDGSGYFETDEDRLIWHDDKAEGYDVVIFVRNEETQGDMDMINPWVYTEDIEQAIAVSAVTFNPPIEEALPEGFSLVTYAGNINGIISAEYESEDRILMIRKSDLYDGQVLSGDYNIYSENWQQVLKGLAIDCYGDGETINLAYFGTDNMHYTVSCLPKADFQEGNGLTADEMNSLIMGMQ